CASCWRRRAGSYVANRLFAQRDAAHGPCGGTALIWFVWRIAIRVLQRNANTDVAKESRKHRARRASPGYFRLGVAGGAQADVQRAWRAQPDVDRGGRRILRDARDFSGANGAGFNLWF